MDVIRRNTDYGLRAMIFLAGCYGKDAVSARTISEQADVAYHVLCKLLQKFADAGLVKSKMGSKGGFVLAKEPAEISLGSMIEIIQGSVSINRCLLDPSTCGKQGTCPLSKKLGQLQDEIDGFLSGATLADLVGENDNETDEV
jgi:Rrf2 family protein